MEENKLIERRSAKNKLVRALVDKSREVCFAYFNESYTYSNQEAVEELGLDDELINHLVEDYVAQIIKSVMLFEEYLEELAVMQENSEVLDFTKLHELAHKNLGVAKNLRIKDGEKLLSVLMQGDEHLENLFKCVEVLHASVIRLKPLYAYHTLKLIEIKNTF